MVWSVFGGPIFGDQSQRRAFPCSVALILRFRGAFPCSMALVLHFSRCFPCSVAVVLCFAGTLPCSVALVRFLCEIQKQYITLGISILLTFDQQKSSYNLRILYKITPDVMGDCWVCFGHSWVHFGHNGFRIWPYAYTIRLRYTCTLYTYNVSIQYALTPIHSK